MPCPSKLDVKYQRVGATPERALDGTLIAEPCAFRRVYTLKWSALTVRELERLADALEGNFIVAELPGEKGAETVVCCCTGRSQGLLSAASGRLLWRDVQLTLTER